jgi:hypothetical protein
MPPKKAATTTASIGEASNNGAPSLTQNEYSFIGAMLSHMNSKPDVDWDGVAQDCGLKDAKCTKERYRQMSVKHGWNNAIKKSTDGPAVPKTPTKNKVTKPRATKKRAKKDPEPAPQDDEEGDDMDVM